MRSPFEQAHNLWNRELIVDATWCEWELTFASWRHTRYVAFVRFLT